MVFLDGLHKGFYDDSVLITNSSSDPYRKALFYALGLTAETRNNIDDLYDFKDRCICFDGLIKGWQTGTSKKVVRLAFNLYNGSAFESEEDCLSNNASTFYVVDEIFCCGLAPYFWEAIQIRYPEYTRPVGTCFEKDVYGVENKDVLYPAAKEKIGDASN